MGTGGMGTVHAGVDPSGLRGVTKLVHASHTEDPEFRARFRREALLSAPVQGPCLIPLLAADPDAETPWLATAYAPGLTLDRHLAAHGPLTGGTLYAFAAGTAQAIVIIHAAGVIHRDVKPQNVIINPAGPRRSKEILGRLDARDLSLPVRPELLALRGLRVVDRDRFAYGTDELVECLSTSAGLSWVPMGWGSRLHGMAGTTSDTEGEVCRAMSTR